uniref:Uncharacterized protein n=1 Tax=Timspurckia oligopyrenoides TaxID=708627 RepID=A0A7S1EQL7_9RHOD|mmetsp:Transcript_12222/g.22102  ORF Transcript_12222/g.22102 Transcript_12222/m.22102 type:complete len:441 (+) Transcript_12222:100-1422(+)
MQNKWSEPRIVELESAHIPSIGSGGLCADRDGRYAFVAGRKVICLRRAPKTTFSQSLDFELALSIPHDRVDISAFTFWPNIPTYSRPLIVVATDRFLEFAPQLSIFDTTTRSGTLIASYKFPSKPIPSHGSSADDSFRSGSDTSRSFASTSQSKLDETPTPRNQDPDSLSLEQMNALEETNAVTALAAVWMQNLQSSSHFLVGGSDNGALLLFSFTKASKATLKSENFRLVDVLLSNNLNGSIHSVTGDLVKTQPIIAACDEFGAVSVWTNQTGEENQDSWIEQLILASPTGSTPSETGGGNSSEDHAAIVRVAGDLLMIARRTGLFEVHRIESKRTIFRAFVSTMPISAVDVHALLGLALIAGEDGRVTLLVLPAFSVPDIFQQSQPDTPESGAGSMFASFGLNGAVSGACFSKPQGPENPSIIILPCERPYLLRYDYE